MHFRPRRAVGRATVQHRIALHYADVVFVYPALALSSRTLVPAHPHGSVRSSGSVLIGGWQSGQADRFSLSQPPSVSLSLSLRSAPRSHAAGSPSLCHPSSQLSFPSFSLSLSISYASCILSLSRSLSSSPVQHTFRVFSPPRMPFSLSFSRSLHFPPFTTLPFIPRRRCKMHSSSSRRSSPFTLTTPLSPPYTSHPRTSLPSRRDEGKYLCRCIVSRFPSTRGIPAPNEFPCVLYIRVCVCVSHTRRQNECFMPMEIRVGIPMRSIVNRYIWRA